MMIYRLLKEENDMSMDFEPKGANHPGSGDSSSRFSETAENVKLKAGQMASATAARAREMTSTVGHKVREFAGRIRDRSEGENATNRIADKLESAGTYLEEKSFEGMAEDLATVIRRYPLQALLVGIGIGLLLGRRRDNY
jgi:ElaB/YqjD/DUF883 family membrane-anchored ribosome-binding protein